MAHHWLSNSLLIVTRLGLLYLAFSQQRTQIDDGRRILVQGVEERIGRLSASRVQRARESALCTSRSLSRLELQYLNLRADHSIIWILGLLDTSR